MLGILTALSCIESIFSSLYWYETNEHVSKREHWSWAIVMICEISRATLARVFMLCYSLGLTKSIKDLEHYIFFFALLFIISITISLIYEHSHFNFINGTGMSQEKVWAVEGTNDILNAIFYAWTLYALKKSSEVLKINNQYEKLTVFKRLYYVFFIAAGFSILLLIFEVEDQGQVKNFATSWKT
jgi:hypothetical protein